MLLQTLLLLALPFTFAQLPGNGTDWTFKPDATSNSTGTKYVTAKIQPATANGSTISITGVQGSVYDSFLGIPFAQPPIGELRFAHPLPAVYNSTNITAIKTPPACLQPKNLLDGGAGLSEDCLTLNVLTPRGAVGNASLPVMVWIYGGSFLVGAGSTYLSPFFMNYGIQTKRPVILVTFNYRLGIFGWGTGHEMADNGAANLGLRDQILALQWVKENIAAFGGDPHKVTAFGQSAGAISVSLLMLNQTTDLFRGAIMQSGAQSTATLGKTANMWQKPFDDLLSITGCGRKNATTSVNSTTPAVPTNQTSFQCLKALSGDQLTFASMAVKIMPQYAAATLWIPSIDGDLIPDSPANMLKNGTFARIPFITGNVRDEGTGTLPPTANGTIGQLINGLYFDPVPASTLNKVIERYPPDPSLGSPFGTGNNTFGLAPVYKQAAAILGDGIFQSRRRWFLRQANEHGFNKTWTYQFEGPTPGQEPRLGISHGTDVVYTFGALGMFGNYSLADYALSQKIMSYWINFAYYLDPNGPTLIAGNSTANATTPASYWEPHSYPSNKNSLRLVSGNVTRFQDDYREEQMSVFFVDDVYEALHFKRSHML